MPYMAAYAASFVLGAAIAWIIRDIRARDSLPQKVQTAMDREHLRMSRRLIKLEEAALFAINHPQPVDVHNALHDALDPESGRKAKP